MPHRRFSFSVGGTTGCQFVLRTFTLPVPALPPVTVCDSRKSLYYVHGPQTKSERPALRASQPARQLVRGEPGEGVRAAYTKGGRGRLSQGHALPWPARCVHFSVQGMSPRSCVHAETLLLKYTANRIFSKWEHCKYRLGDKDANIFSLSLTLNLFRFRYRDL